MLSVESKSQGTRFLLERFESALNKLSSEIQAYPNDWKIWIREGEIQNSAGTLCMYLLSKIHEASTLLMGKSFAEDQYHAEHATRSNLVEKVVLVKNVMVDLLVQSRYDDLNRDFPVPYRGNVVTASTYLYFLLTEVYFHIGQINYHRRLI